MALMHEDFFTLGGIFTLAGFVVEEFYCILHVILCYFQTVLPGAALVIRWLRIVFHTLLGSVILQAELASRFVSRTLP